MYEIWREREARGINPRPHPEPFDRLRAGSEPSSAARTDPINYGPQAIAELRSTDAGNAVIRGDAWIVV